LQQRAASILLGEQTTVPYSVPNTYGAQTSFNGAFGGNALGNRNILVITPRSNQEVNVIVEHLRTGEACIVCLDGIPIAEAQRRIDFLSGVVCALNGIIRSLDANKYVLTPSGVGVRN
jgi:FtsZ-interacting cell division protein YlmF